MFMSSLASVKQTRSPSKWVAAISREPQWIPVQGGRLWVETGCQEYEASLHWERNQCKTHRRHRRVQSCTFYPSISWHYSTLMYVRYIPLLMDHSGFVCAWRTFQWRPHHHEDCLKMLEAPSSISQRLIIFLRFCINWFAQEKNHLSATNHIISCPACHPPKNLCNISCSTVSCFVLQEKLRVAFARCQLRDEGKQMAWREEDVYSRNM